ncbi:MAG: HdeD family acid-resistance protein [Microlunatus sp.]|nr:HdeD family acid-resistance protein [Microlunatus sp.]MDN5769548.1 HdeD family acid-resistance protein [Microlunatus sp.]MDN5803776.1 HdeD family acid-resistance protein [Microlunatus sp.]
MSMLSPSTVSEQYAQIAKGAWVWAVVRGAVAIVFGIVAMLAPLTTAVVLAIIIGIFAIVDGIVDLVDAIRHRGSPGVGLRVVLGVISLLFGIIILVWPGKTLGFMVILIAIWAIAIGVLQIVSNLSIRSEAGGAWIWGVIAGALGVVFGILVLFNLTIGLAALIWLLGIWAIVFGIALIFLGVQVRKASKTATRGGNVD